jgi:hypothetical protein
MGRDEPPCALPHARRWRDHIAVFDERGESGERLAKRRHRQSPGAVGPVERRLALDLTGPPQDDMSVVSQKRQKLT